MRVSCRCSRRGLARAMERALACAFALQRSMQCLSEFVLDNLFASKYTIVKLKLQVKRSRWKRVSVAAKSRLSSSAGLDRDWVILKRTSQETGNEKALHAGRCVRGAERYGILARGIECVRLDAERSGRAVFGYHHQGHFPRPARLQGGLGTDSAIRERDRHQGAYGSDSVREHP